VLGRNVDERTDVYLLGATLHALLTGRPRHDGKTVEDVMRAALISAPYVYEAAVPEPLAQLCNRATARLPQDRPPSAAALREALAAFLRSKNANDLAHAAFERVSALESLVSVPDGPMADVALAHRLAAEARFGLTESLRQDPNGAAALRGMRRLRAAVIDLELRQDHLETAEALLAEIESPEAELVRRVETCRERARARAREHARHAELARDADPSVDAPTRTRRLIALTLLVSLAAVGIWAAGPQVTAASILVAGIAILVVLVSVLFVGHKRLTNAFNRRAAAFMVLAMGAMVANRTAALFEGRPPEETLRHDLLILIVLVLAGAITVLRELWVCLAALTAGYVALWLWREVATPIFSVTMIVNLGIAAVVLARARRKA
jgi:serine/threonine-protein kinase